MSKQKGCVRITESSPSTRPRRSRTAERVKLEDTEDGRIAQVGRHKEMRGKLKPQSELISKLIADNARLVSQVSELTSHNTSTSANSSCSVSVLEQNLKSKEEMVQGLMAHVCSLREEFKLLSSNFQSSSPQVAGLLDDLKRLTYKNADLCNALAATQCSRNVLERDIIVLKRTQLEERSAGAQFPEIKELLIQNERLKKLLDQRQLEIDELSSHARAQNKKLKASDSDITGLNQEIEQLRQSQLTEIDARCKEVDSLKQQLSGQLSSLQQDRNTLSHELTAITAERNSLLQKLAQVEVENSSLEKELSKRRCQCETHTSRLKSVSDHAEQMELENAALHSKLAEFQRHQESDLQQARNAYVQVKDQLEKSTSNMQTVLSELESVRRSRLDSCQHLSECKTKVDALRSQLSSCLQVNREMKRELEERAARIEHLEKLLHKQDFHKQNENLSSSFAFDGIRSCVGPIASPSLSVQTPAVASDFVNMKQRLTNSRHVTVHLEVQLAQLKTDNAKLSGSYQAMLSIRDHLSQDNSQIRGMCKDLQCDREALLTEKQLLLCQVEEMSSNSNVLTTDLTTLKSGLCHLSELYQQREDQLCEYRAQILQTTDVRGQLECLQNVVETEVLNFTFLSDDFNDTVVSCQQKVSDLHEEIRICGRVNSTRRGQIEMCDESVLRLQGEVEVLRARKAVLCVSDERYSLRISTHSCMDNCSQVKKLKQKLKLQRKQANFLRVKLGYTLTELRLYKQLKRACDQQLYELQACLQELQSQYQHCAVRLEAVEQLN